MVIAVAMIAIVMIGPEAVTPYKPGHTRRVKESDARVNSDIGTEAPHQQQVKDTNGDSYDTSGNDVEEEEEEEEEEEIEAESEKNVVKIIPRASHCQDIL
ncbi:hypothetical protein BGZ79_006496 [Entomortierella chlamydospora]|nr:hypothetical protein BGZ79_006496 [Entomortierella chlamydospora]